MFIKLFKSFMRTEPPDVERAYIFLVDNEELAFNIIAQGYCASPIRENREGCFTLEQFEEYLHSIALTGTNMTDYTYVPGCGSKKANDRLEEILASENLKCRQGWKLFKDREYLEKFDNEKELREILHHFIVSYEEPPEYSETLKEFHEVDESGKPSKVLDLNIVEYLIKTVPFIVIGSTPYVYQDGCYIQDNRGILLKEKIQRLIHREKVNSPTINRVYQLLTAQKPVQRNFEDLYNYPAHWVNFKNGFYDPLGNRMVEHDPKYLAVNQIPHEFYPGDAEKVLAGGANIRRYLEYSVPNETEQQMLWEYLGYSMTADTQFQKFLMILGNGGTGKSVIIDLFQKVIGRRNCSNVSLQDLNKRFYATTLFGKLLNACGDIPCNAMDATDVVKKATGEDMLQFERKGQDPLFFFSHAKLLFSANDMPENLEEKTDAFYRRLLVLDVNRAIPTEKKDTQLKKKIGGELDYAIHMAMKALRDLYGDMCFSESTHSRECVQVIQRASDSVKAFTDERISRQREGKIEKSAMYRMYDEYCRDADRKPLGKKKFFNLMDRKGFFCRKTNGIFYYFGVCEKEADFEPADDLSEIPFEQDEKSGQMRLPLSG